MYGGGGGCFLPPCSVHVDFATISYSILCFSCCRGTWEPALPDFPYVATPEIQKMADDVRDRVEGFGIKGETFCATFYWVKKSCGGDCYFIQVRCMCENVFVVTRSVYYPGVYTIQECVPTMQECEPPRSVYYPGVCTNQECVLTNRVY